MDQLMEDIVHTADSFTNNFGDDPPFPFIRKGAFDYSIESLAIVDQLLEELSDYGPDEDALYNTSTMVGCYVFETARKITAGNISGCKKSSSRSWLPGCRNSRSPSRRGKRSGGGW